MKKILCPTDFSATAHNAIDYAAGFAKKAGAELSLFNVQSMFSLSPGELLSREPKTLERARKILESQAHEVESAFHVTCHGEMKVSEETLSTVISEQGKDFDLIIMGTNGPDDMYQFFFGTNSYHVFRHSGLPLIIVPDTTRFTSIKRIVLAYDYLHLGKPPMKQAYQWLKNFDAEFRFLQLMRRPLTEDEKVIRSRHKLEIEYELADEFDVSFETIVTTEFNESIQHYMLSSDSDLLVLSTHPYSIAEKLFHKSLAKKLTADFMYPVMIVHE